MTFLLILICLVASRIAVCFDLAFEPSFDLMSVQHRCL
jgi:hypothetical protein